MWVCAMCNAGVCGVQRRALGPQNENYRWFVSCPVQVQGTEPGSLTTEFLLGSFEEQLTKRCFLRAWTGKAVAGW